MVEGGKTLRIQTVSTVVTSRLVWRTALKPSFPEWRHHFLIISFEERKLFAAGTLRKTQELFCY
jgi:hypothetical protein